MHRLEVFELGGRTDVATPAEVAAVLGRRVGAGNHFEIAAAGTTHPFLTLMVRDDFAVVHFFATEHDRPVQSRGNLHAVPAAVSFPEIGGGEVSLPGSAIVDVVTATRCVAEFASTCRRPAAVEWLKL